MTTVCFLVHSFIHASTPTSFGSNVISISTTTALVKLPLQPSALLIYLPLLLCFVFFSIYHLSIHYTALLFIMFSLGFLPTKPYARWRILGCFGHHCAPASRTVLSGEHSSVN